MALFWSWFDARYHPGILLQDSTIPPRGHRQAPQKAWDRSRRTAALTAAATALGLGVGGRARARQAAGGGTDRGVLQEWYI